MIWYCGLFLIVAQAVFCGDGYKWSADGCVRLRGKRDASGEEEEDENDCSRNMKLDESEYDRLDNNFLFVKSWNVTLSSKSYRIVDSTLYLCHPNTKTATETDDNVSDDSDTLVSCSDGRPFIQFDEGYIMQANGSVFVLEWNMTINADEYRFVDSILEVCDPFPIGYNEFADDPLANCNYTVLNLPKEEYNLLANDSVLVPELNAIFNPDEYVLYHSVLFVCSSFTRSDFGESVATLVGIVISLVSLVVLLVIYMVFSELRNTPGKCVICLAVSLFVGQFSFCFIGLKGAFCFYLAAIVHYAFLASFTWTSILAFDICRTFLSPLAYSDGGPKSRRFLYYSAFAWGLPLVIVATCICMDLSRPDDAFSPGYGDGDVCWISRRMSLIVFFMVPLGVSLVGNIVLFSVTVYRMCQSCRKSGKVLDQKNSKVEVFVCVKLSFIMGLTWAFAFLANFTEWTAMWYLFIVFNTLQGAFLCFAFVGTKKVFRLLRPKTKSRFSGAQRERCLQLSSSTAPGSP